MAADTRLDDGTRLSDHLEVDSAGTGNWHAGEPMDPRAAEVLTAHGYIDHGHRARAFEARWFDRYDLVVALARSHQQTLQSLAHHRAGKAEGDEAKLVLLRSYDRAAGGQVDVPDPYYGEYADFEECLTMVEAGWRGLVGHLVEVPAGQGNPAGQAERQSPEGCRFTNDSAS